MAELTIGVVSYSNTAPLTAGLPEDHLRRGVPSDVPDSTSPAESSLSLTYASSQPVCERALF